MSDLTELGRQIINGVMYLTLATADAEGNPWCTPVFTAFDDKFVFYWSSGFETRHSKNIRNNARASAVIYDSSCAIGGGEGVYMEGRGEELTPETWQDGFRLLRVRSSEPEKYYPPGSFETLGPVRIYRFIPSAFYMLDPSGDPRYAANTDRRVKVDFFSKQ